MARRLNTRFVILVAGTLVVIVVAALILKQLVSTTAEEHVERGEQLWDQDEMRLAVDEFGKAVAKRPQDLSLLMLYADHVSRMRLSSPWEARDYLRFMRLSWERVIQLDPGNPEAFTDLMNLYMRLGRDLEVFEIWTVMYDRCQEALTRRPDLMEAFKYRGIAQTIQIGELDVDEEIREQAKQDLRQALTHDPNDLEVYDQLVQWHLKEAVIDEYEHAPPEVPVQLRETARALSDEMIVQHSEDPVARLYRCRTLLDLGDHKAAVPLLVELEKQVLEQDTSVWATLQMANLLTRLDAVQGAVSGTLAGWQRAETVLRRALERWATEARLYLSLGHVLNRLGKTQEAIDIYKQGRDVPASGDPVSVHLQAKTQMSCTFGYINARLDGLGSVANAATRTQIVDDSEQQMENLSKLSGDVWQIHLLRGKIATARGQWEAARIQLDEASAKTQDSNMDVLMRSAKVREALGEWGAAAERYERAIELSPTFLRPYSELAKLHMRVQELGEAEQVLNKLLSRDPGNMRGQRLKAALFVRRDQIDEAIDLLWQLNPDEHPELLPTLADYHVRADRSDEARKLFERYFKDHPTSLIVLQELVGMAQDDDAAMAYVAQAREAGADEKVLDLLAAKLSGQDVEAEALKIIETGGSDLERHLKRYELYVSLDKYDDAMAELDAAAKLNPNHPTVVAVQFEHALAEQAWERARVLAGIAADSNLDRGMGNFYFGRLYHAQGDLDRAEISFRDGLNHRGVYSDGWRLLADVQLVMGDLSEAAASYRNAIQQRPNNVAALSGLAQVHHRQLDFARSLEQLRKAINFAPGNRALRANYLRYEQEYGEPENALAFCQRRAETDPSDTDNQRMLSFMLAQQDRQEEAIQMIDRIIDQEGETLVNVRTKAGVLAEGGELQAGRDLMQNYVVGLGDQAAVADWLDLGRFLLNYGETDAARSVYRRAIKIEDPDLRPASSELADRLFQIDRFEEASGLYGELWKARPDGKWMGMRHVEALVRSDNLEEAESALKAVAQNDFDDPGILILKGLLAQAKGQTDVALKAYNQSIEKSPHSATPYYRRALLLFNDLSKRDQVESDLQQALKLNRDLADARRLLAKIHIQQGEPSQAIRELESLVRRAPGDLSARAQLAELYFQKRDGPALLALSSLLKESRELFPEDPTWPSLMAQLSMVTGKVDVAIEHFRSSLKLRARPATVARLAALLIRTKQPEAALALLRDHAELTSNISQLLALRGHALSDLDRADESAAAFALALQKSRTLKSVSNIAKVMMTTLGASRAIKELEALASGKLEIPIALTIAQLHADRGDYSQSLAILKKIQPKIEPDSNMQSFYERLLVVGQHESGDVRAARESYERMLDRNPDDVTSLNNLACILTERDESERAVELALRADRLAPNNPMVLDTLGWAQFKAGRMSAARNNLERSIEMRSMASNQIHLALFLEKQREYRRAAELANAVLEMASEQSDQALREEARNLLERLNKHEQQVTD